jgi:hypothetical protein
MTIETSVQEAIDSINALSKYVKTHQSAIIDYDLLDELETAVAEIQEIAYDLEARAQDPDEDLEGYEAV